MLALFGWFLSEQPGKLFYLSFFFYCLLTIIFIIFNLAINPAKRQYVTQQSSIVEDNEYAVMHNCAVPYCTNASPATTINSLYLTYYYYSATQVTSNGNTFQTFSLFFFVFLYILNKLCE